MMADIGHWRVDVGGVTIATIEKESGDDDMSEQHSLLGGDTQAHILRVDDICDRFENAWRAGGRPSVGEFLQFAGYHLASAPEDLVRELNRIEEVYRRQVAVQVQFHITLTVIRGVHIGRSFTFDRHDLFIVGRSQKAHFRLAQKDDAISRVHFLIETNPPSCRLIDMGSANGTFRNGTRVDCVDLADGDEIRAGETTLRVSVIDSESSGVTRLLAPVGDPQTPAKSPPARAAEGKSPSAENQPKIPGYEVIRRLGGGGMGVVYLGRRIADGSQVALKVIRPAVAGTKPQIDRFLREANILGQLKHPNIVTFRDVGEASGLLYFAMDCVEGFDAAAMLKRDGAMAIGRAVGWICQLLDALGYAHARQFVHRDIKPSNLMVTVDRGREAIRLVDFGLARVYQASALSGVTMSGQSGGTPAFMAPEQITNFREVLPPADLYAAGATLYNLLTNQYLFDCSGTIPQRMVRILQEQPIPVTRWRPDLPAGLVNVIERSLVKNPSDRFPDAEAMGDALRPFAV